MWIAWLPLCAVLGAEPSLPEKPSPPPARGSQPLEDRPEPFQPRQPITEEQRDRLDAVALFATGRMLERQENYAEALRKYQRALRCDGRSGETLYAIIHLATRLNRAGEVGRYARKAVDLDAAKSDVVLLSRLGLLLAKQGDWESAARLYEKVLESRTGDTDNATDVLLRMELGRLDHLLEKYDRAAENFARVPHALEHPEQYGLTEKMKAELVSEPGPLYNLFGDAFLQAGRLAEARAAFEKSFKATQDKGVRGFHLARVEARSGKPQEALASLQVYFDLGLSSEGMAPYQLLGEILEKLNKSGELISRLEKLRKTDSGNVPLGYFLADRYREKKRFDKAEPVYQAMLQKTPAMLGFRGLLEVYRHTRRPEPLLGVLGQAVDKASALEPLGSEIKALVEDAALGDHLIDTARRQHRENAKRPEYPVRVAVALLALEAKKEDAAKEFFELAIQAQPKHAPELLLEWGLSLLVDEKSDQAVEIFRRGTKLKTKAATQTAFQYYLAGALAAAKRYDEALAAARKAAESERDSARLACRVAWVLYVAKRHEEAEKAFTTLLDRFGSEFDSPETRQAVREAKLILSNLCVLRSETAQGEEWLEQVLAEFPDDVSASNDLGYLWAERGVHLNRALRMIRHALKAEPDNAAYRDSLGWVYSQLGQNAEAVAELEKAAAGDKPDAVILEHLGDAYLKQKQLDKAKQAWQRALEMFRQEKEQEKARQVEEKLKM